MRASPILTASGHTTVSTRAYGWLSPPRSRPSGKYGAGGGFQSEVAQVALAAVGECRMSRVDQELEPGTPRALRAMLLRYGRG
jgi:hypothetical protein